MKKEKLRYILGFVELAFVILGAYYLGRVVLNIPTFVIAIILAIYIFVKFDIYESIR